MKMCLHAMKARP